MSEPAGTASRLSPVSGGSEGTTDRVFRQSGHMKQLRAHLRLGWVYIISNLLTKLPVLLSTYTRTGNLEKTIWTIVGTDFNRNTSITPHGVAFFAEEKGVKRVKVIRWWRKMGWWWYWRCRETRTVVLDAWTSHCFNLLKVSSSLSRCDHVTYTKDINSKFRNPKVEPQLELSWQSPAIRYLYTLWLRSRVSRLQFLLPMFWKTWQNTMVCRI